MYSMTACLNIDKSKKQTATEKSAAETNID